MSPWEKRKNLFSYPTPKAVREPKVRWRLMPILWLAFKRTCMVLGAVVLITSVITLWGISSVISQIDTSLPDEMVLYLSLDGDVGDLPRDPGFANLFAAPTKTVKNYTDALNRAAKDPRVKGVYAHYKGGGYAIAHLEELRQAIHNFRASGKFAYIYASSYDGGLGSYYLASSFDSIWMQPMGTLVIPGLSAEIPFFRSILDYIGIEPQFFQRKEYKNAYESITNKDISPANRENTMRLIADIYDVFIADIARDRGLSKDDVDALIDRGLFIGEEGVEAGLIDRLDYADALVDEIEGDLGNRFDYVRFDSYISEMFEVQKMRGFAGLPSSQKKRSHKPKVALVYAVGAIMDRDHARSQAPSVLLDDGIAAADEIAGALFDISKDSSIRAVVLRIDSPGGSPVASETILRAIEKVQASGKTVTVSMGPVAASGGYWIAALADHIFVSKTTITGSIGVLGGKFSMKPLWDKWGVNWVGIQQGDKAGMWSANDLFSASEAERVNAMLDNVYDNFLARVAKGRDMRIEDVDKIAGGRIWTGLSAVDIGLADKIGGLDDALDYAAVQAGGISRADVDVVIMPTPLSPIEKFIKTLEGQVMAQQIIGSYAAILSPFMPDVQEAVMYNTYPVLIYEPVRVD